jgi:hypothetical protein
VNHGRRVNLHSEDRCRTQRLLCPRLLAKRCNGARCGFKQRRALHLHPVRDAFSVADGHGAVTRQRHDWEDSICCFLFAAPLNGRQRSVSLRGPRLHALAKQSSLAVDCVILMQPKQSVKTDESVRELCPCCGTANVEGLTRTGLFVYLRCEKCQQVWTIPERRSVPRASDRSRVVF